MAPLQYVLGSVDQRRSGMRKQLLRFGDARSSGDAIMHYRTREVNPMGRVAPHCRRQRHSICSYLIPYKKGAAYREKYVYVACCSNAPCMGDRVRPESMTTFDRNTQSDHRPMRLNASD